ncbi:hypothetical protein JKP88DRAFT_196873 [Tribonema minus]|uniref:Microsomal glutathione S-transferase 3 n=1 Tax=Tribonema minus TaxID=303371 RepID=A0A835ZDZ8_9STRA|nr:hypothetical protein JKP88DRAFT_196873 [Tribonema minus]
MPEAAFRGGAAVTLAYLALYSILLTWQSATKNRKRIAAKKRDEKVSCSPREQHYYGNQDKDVVCADRTVGNFLEQALPFLVTFWLALASCGDSNCASVVYRGWAYVFFRALYPVMWKAGGGGLGGVRPLILVSTLPGYLLCYSFMYNIIRMLMSPKA